MASKPRESKHTSHVQLELEALLRFFRKTGGDRGCWHVDQGWTALPNSVRQTADMILLRGSMEQQLPLFGVKWERNHVVEIDLSANGLSGRVTKEISSLRNLKMLKLRNNPQLQGQLPTELYRMPHLQYCYLDGTSLESILPHQDAFSFQITRLHPVATTRGITSPAASIVFSTLNRSGRQTRWVADMTEAELFMVHSSLKARHEKARQVVTPESSSCTASNATGPERVAAAVKLQRIYRARIERTKFRNFLKSLFEKHYDSTTGYNYFVDKRTGETMWERPKYVATTPRSAVEHTSESNQDVWQAFDDGNGYTYYWNRLTGESTWEPPVFLSRIYQELRDRYGTARNDEERFDMFFRDIDKDNTGSIDRDEFARLCGELGMAMSPKQIDKVFDELDTSGDGELSREEIIAWLTRNY